MVRASYAMTDKIVTIDKSTLGDYIGELSEEDMQNSSAQRASKRNARSDIAAGVPFNHVRKGSDTPWNCADATEPETVRGQCFADASRLGCPIPR